MAARWGAAADPGAGMGQSVWPRLESGAGGAVFAGGAVHPAVVHPRFGATGSISWLTGFRLATDQSQDVTPSVGLASERPEPEFCHSAAHRSLEDATVGGQGRFCPAKTRGQWRDQSTGRSATGVGWSERRQ